MILRLTNDDEPAAMRPRMIAVVRTGLSIGAQQAVVAVVTPPLECGEEVAVVVLASRRRGVTIDEIINMSAGKSGHVYVCQYLGREREIPDRLSRQDVSVLLWGRLEAVTDDVA